MIIHVIRVHNILDPRDQTRETMPFKNGQTLAELFPTPAGQAHPYGLSINGRVIDPEDRAQVRPQAGDCVVLSIMPAGSNGKSILRIVAIIALASVAPVLGAQISASMGGGMFLGSVAGLNMMSGLVMLAGTAVINSLLPPPKPPSLDSASSSPSYGIDGAKNTSAEGIVVPVTYGQFRMGGNIVGNYVVNDGDSQFLHMLICAGEGEIASITDIELNDQPLANFEDYTVETRMGTSTQSTIPWFAGVIVPENVNQEFTEDWKTFTVGSPGTDVMDGMRFDVVCPGGLFELDSKGSLKSRTVEIEIQYRRAGTTDAWQAIAVSDKVVSYNSVTEWVAGTPYTGPTIIDGDTIYADAGEGGLGGVVGHIKKVAVYSTVSSLEVKGAQREALRRSFTTPALSEDAYEVRYRRTEPKSEETDISEAIFLSDINKIINEKVAYRHTALLALKIRLSDQLNSLPNVTFLNGGKLIKVFDETTGAWKANLESNANPAWVAYDILTNKRYGGGCNESRIALSVWRDWAMWCDTEKLRFHGIFDTQSNVWDACTVVSRCGRAQLIQHGTKYSVVIERAAAPVQMFSVANIFTGTFKETWSSMSERANEVEVNYNDKNDKYRQRTVRLYDQFALAAGQPQRVATVDIRGIVDSDRAYDEGRLLLKLNRHVKRSIEFSTSIEAIACSVGDVILVQHDMPAWGVGGLMKAGAGTTTLKFDRPVLIEGGKTYAALIHYPTLQRWSGTVHSVIGNTVVLAGFTGTTAVKRLVIGANEYNVDSVVEVGANYGVMVPDATGITAGQTAALFDTNAMVSVPIYNPLSVGSFDEFTDLITGTPLPSAPPALTKWMFGETSKVAKPFRVTGISGSHEYRRDIRAIEYDEAVYDLDNDYPIINYSALDPRLVADAIIEGVVENAVFKDKVWDIDVTIAFRSPQQTYKESIVYLSRNGGVFSKIGTAKTKLTMAAQRGDVLTFKVVATDINGNQASFTTAPTETYTVLGQTTGPSNVTDLNAQIKPSQVHVTWALPSDISYDSTELRVGASWAAGTPLVSPGPTRSGSGSFNWPRPANGTYTIRARHRDTAGFYSPSEATVTIVVDNTIDAVGTPGAPAVGAILSPEVIALPSDNAGVVTSYAANKAYLSINLGGAIDTGNWTITEAFKTVGLTTTLVGGELTVTAMSNSLDVGYVDLQATRTGYGTITKRVIVVKTKAGGDGDAGAPGADGLKIAQVALYQWSTTEPGNPTDTTNYDWFALQHTGTPGAGWSTTLPANPGVVGIRLWVAQKSISATAATEDSVVTWTAGTFTKEAISANGNNGAAGAPGANGFRNATVRAYKWSTAPAPTATGTATYTWATGAISAVPSGGGWTTTPTASPTPGLTLWEARINLIDALTTATTAINWSTASVLAVGYAGDVGPSGSQGVSARVAYSLATGGVGALASTPASVTVTGDGRPANNTWGTGTVWVVSPPAPGTNQSVWVTDGLYNPVTNQTVWYAPYLASLRVGQLSAISANLGSITAGSINIADKAIIDADGEARFKAITIEDGSGNVMLASGGKLDAKFFGGVVGGGNLLPNSSFELDSDNDGAPDHWTTTINFGGGVFIDRAISTAVPLHGSKNLLLSVTGFSAPTQNRHFVQTTNFIPVQPNTKYFLSAWLRTGHLDYQGDIGIGFFDATDTIIGAYQYVPAHTFAAAAVWERIGQSFSSPANAVSCKVRVGFRRPSIEDTRQSVFRIDGVQLEQGDVPTAYAPSSIDKIGIDNQITSLNVSTYISAAAITWAQIGNLVIGTAGAIRSGQTAWNTGTGWWLGHESGDPKFSIGSPAGPYMRWSPSGGLEVKANTITKVSGPVEVMGNYAAIGARIESTGASVTVIAEIQFRRDGTIWRNVTPAGGGSNLVQSGQWYDPVTSDIGDDYDIIFSYVSGTKTGLTNNASDWTQLSATRTYRLSFTSTTQFSMESFATYAVRLRSTGKQVGTGNIALLLERAF